jgi:GNAT superfamily N-acetyltransferase
MNERPAPPPGLRFRRPAEADYPGIAAVVDDWWDGRVLHGLLPRLWFRHFAGTSWLAEADGPQRPDGPDGPDGRPRVAGFLVGFVSPLDPGVGVIQAVGVDPNRRRLGIGRALVKRFVEDLRAAGGSTVETLAWPDNRRALRFLAALGFEPDTGPGSRPLYGIPAFEGYNFGTEDRARFFRKV